MTAGIDIKTTIRGNVPRIPFEQLKKEALGNRYELSLVICGDELARKMNTQYRKKTYAANVLSFPYGKEDGEIFLNVRCAAREAKKYGTTLQKRLALLYVHGLYHLKGMDHGDKMEMLEKKMLTKYRL